MKRIFKTVAGIAVAALTGAAAQAESGDRWLELPDLPPMPEARESGMAPVNGIQMHYAVYGEGDPVLLIHGGLGHGDVWGAQVKRLMGSRKVIVADSRGHGRSTRNEQPFGYSLMASDYLALLDFLKIDKVALVGWSDGGIIGLDIAINHPERLTRLFAHAANSTTDGVDPAVETDAVFGQYVEKMAAEYERLSPTPDQFGAFVEQISNMWATQPAYTDAQLAAIDVPVDIVLGDHDEAITKVHTQHLVDTIPGAKYIVLEGTSHFAMLQDPQGYNSAILNFLAR